MAGLTELQKDLYEKIPMGWQSETDIWIMMDQKQVKAQLRRMTSKGFLDCKLVSGELYYKKVNNALEEK